MSEILVITHHPCTDGLTSRWVWDKYFRSQDIEVEYHDGQHGDAPPDVTGKIVYLSDFTYPREQMVKMLDQCEYMVVLDHHESARDNLQGLEEHKNMRYLVFDMDRSGALITWEYCFPHEEVPDIVKYVSDGDLWRFKYTHTKAYVEGLRSYTQDLLTYHGLADPDFTDRLITEGGAILRAKMEMVRQSTQFARQVTLFDEKVWVTNVPFFLCSETAHELIRDNRVGITWYQNSDGTYKLSFRSTDGKSAREFAERVRDSPYGLNGGGHGNAAGAGVTELPWWPHSFAASQIVAD